MSSSAGSRPEEALVTVELERVTIVAEAVLEARLLALLKAAGARGWTLGEVRGEGSRGVRAGEWQGNVKLETLVAPAVAERILRELAREYFPRFAVVAYTDRVRVVRGEKYV
ncbi:MAG: transcriptional regulator [Planctomycetes bacterium]|nr:transcriptional regulator [Planctomycetota bacterium]